MPNKANSIPLLCRIFGHKWGSWMTGRWQAPTWWTGGVETFFVCKRCDMRYIDTLPRKQTFESLLELVRLRQDGSDKP